MARPNQPLRIGAVLPILLAALAAQAAQPEPVPMEKPETFAKIARMRAAQQVMANQSMEDRPLSECGSMDLGVVQNGMRGARVTDVTVVVNGDVINMAKCK